ncbi:hypothetical protein [Streptomyces ardesiacus]
MTSTAASHKSEAGKAAPTVVHAVAVSEPEGVTDLIRRAAHDIR